MALCEKILIVGFSGAGKTSFLNQIRQKARPDWVHFEDLDLLVLKKAKNFSDLASFIQSVGWEEFRLKERQELEQWLKQEGKGVLALGGGTLTPLVFELYRKHPKIKFCYLKADFKTCWERLNSPGETLRPLLFQGEHALEKIYQERERLFTQVEWSLKNDSNANLSELANAFWSDLDL